MKKGHRFDARIRLRMVDGRWHAFATGGIKKRRNLQLFIAIRHCEKLNTKTTRNAP